MVIDMQLINSANARLSSKFLGQTVLPKDAIRINTNNVFFMVISLKLVVCLCFGK